MIFKNSKLFIVLLSLVFITLLGISTLAIYDIRLKNRETSVLLQKTREVTDVGGLTQSIKAVQNNFAEDITALDQLVFTNDKLVPLIESIEKKGRELNLDTEIVSVEKKEALESADPNLIHMVIEMEGSWVNSASFLHSIESLPYRVMIDESNLSKVQKNWRLRIAFSIHSFD